MDIIYINPSDILVKSNRDYHEDINDALASMIIEEFPCMVRNKYNPFPPEEIMGSLCVQYTESLSDQSQIFLDRMAYFGISHNLTKRCLSKELKNIFARYMATLSPPDKSKALIDHLKEHYHIALYGNLCYPLYWYIKEIYGDIFLTMTSFTFNKLNADPQYNFLFKEAYRLNTLNQKVFVGSNYSLDIRPYATDPIVETVWYLNRPHREMDNLMYILNDILPKPTRTISHLGFLYSELSRLQTIRKVSKT